MKRGDYIKKIIIILVSLCCFLISFGDVYASTAIEIHDLNELVNPTGSAIIKKNINGKHDITFFDDDKLKIYRDLSLPEMFNFSRDVNCEYEVLNDPFAVNIKFNIDNQLVKIDIVNSVYVVKSKIKVKTVYIVIIPEALYDESGGEGDIVWNYYCYFNLDLPLEQITKVDIQYNTFKKFIFVYDKKEHKKSIYSTAYAEMLGEFDDGHVYKYSYGERIGKIGLLESDDVRFKWKMVFHQVSAVDSNLVSDRIEDFVFLTIEYVTNGSYHSDVVIEQPAPEQFPEGGHYSDDGISIDNISDFFNTLGKTSKIIFSVIVVVLGLLIIGFILRIFNGFSNPYKKDRYRY